MLFIIVVKHAGENYLGSFLSLQGVSVCVCVYVVCGLSLVL